MSWPRFKPSPEYMPEMLPPKPLLSSV